MGRVGRYKREKKVFDVENLFQRSSSKDDAAPSSSLSSSWESKSRNRRLLIKFDAKGKPVTSSDSRRLKKLQRAVDKAKLENGEAPKNKKNSKKEKYEKRANESNTDFLARVGRETQEEIMKNRKLHSSKRERMKEFSKRRKEKRRLEKLEKKHKGSRSNDIADMSEKERQIYFEQADRPTSMHDVAQAPPEFSSKHILKRGADPNDRSRFAKLSFASKADTSADGKRKKTDYEKLQLEAMRSRVLQQYNELRKKRNGEQ